jgi:hypothetical protein
MIGPKFRNLILKNPKVEKEADAFFHQDIFRRKSIELPPGKAPIPA